MVSVVEMRNVTLGLVTVLMDANSIGKETDVTVRHICTTQDNFDYFLSWNKKCCLIILECSPNYYGNDCNIPCGQCRGYAPCNNVTGHCPHGCTEQWDGPKCDGMCTCLTNWMVKDLSNTKKWRIWRLNLYHTFSKTHVIEIHDSVTGWRAMA